MERQAYSDSIATLDGDEGVTEFVGKWVVCWGSIEGRTRLLLGLVWEVISCKSGEVFKDERCMGCVEGTGECVTCSEFAKGKTFSCKQT